MKQRLSLLILFFVLLCGTTPARARTVLVHDAAGLTEAVKRARAGDIIELADGLYTLTSKIQASGSGTQNAPITVRAVHRLGAHIRSAAQIAFEVSGSQWHFADLEITGVCARDTDCEHAFHVVGASTGFVLSGSRIADFNAQVKANGNAMHVLPAHGLIQGNEFYDSHPRQTGNPVAPINIDGAEDWVVRANLIHDFQKDGSGEDGYGAFVKGGAQQPVMERNLIVCSRDTKPMGRMIGLSFGAEGMDANLCPPHWSSLKPCDPEVSGGVIRNNVILNCTGDGIYLNKARDSAVLFNTLVRTAGVEFRYASSTGTVRGNLMTGFITDTQGGHHVDGGNLTGVADQGAFAAWFHPEVRAGLRLPRLTGPDANPRDDFCGNLRGSSLDVGAIQKYSSLCAYGGDGVPDPAWR